MINIQFAEIFSSPPIEPRLLELAAAETLRAASEKPEVEVTILVTGDAQIQQLNREYLQVDAPTDVLSFPADITDPDTNTPYLGDIIISYPRASEQAQAGGHAVEAEVQLLVVHGILHLLGHDHAEPDEKAEMWSIQGEVLQRLGIEPPSTAA